MQSCDERRRRLPLFARPLKTPEASPSFPSRKAMRFPRRTQGSWQQSSTQRTDPINLTTSDPSCSSFPEVPSPLFAALRQPRRRSLH